ncbi:unnamed protein product, partial [Chrysoparadoxa australica]
MQPKGARSEIGVLLELLEKQLASKQRLAPAGVDPSTSAHDADDAETEVPLAEVDKASRREGDGFPKGKRKGRKARLLAYLGELEGRVVQAEALTRHLKAKHTAEVAELEQEFDLFLEENGLNDEKCVAIPVASASASDSMAVSELEEELSCARDEAQSWKVEVERLRMELEASKVAEKEAAGMAASAAATSAMLLKESVVETVLEEEE